VAGQGFEPWKASADGFTVRCRSVELRQAISANSRALRVPFMEGTSGHSRLTMAAETAVQRLYPAHVELFVSNELGDRHGEHPLATPHSIVPPALLSDVQIRQAHS
jgi:hypothetical protein